MPSPHRTYEIRCPVHGLIVLNDWERTVISQPAFQRLRRIRQLAWTDYVYPGAMHTRFEHSIGVMHTATLLYDAIRRCSEDVLKADLAYNSEGLGRDRQLVRFGALLHDVGHSPFSHASEDLFPDRDDGKKLSHEDYSVAIIKTELRSALEDHPLNANYGFRAEDISSLIEGSARAKQAVFWCFLARLNQRPNGCGQNGLSAERFLSRGCAVWGIRPESNNVNHSCYPRCRRSSS